MPEYILWTIVTELDHGSFAAVAYARVVNGDPGEVQTLMQPRASRAAAERACIALAEELSTSIRARGDTVVWTSGGDSTRQTDSYVEVQ